MKRGHLRSCRELGRSLWRVGWVRSWATRQSVDSTGRPLPWMTYPFIRFIESRSDLLSTVDCFEYGCGNSTLWWSQRLRSVHAIESDPKWFDRISRDLPGNINLRLAARDSTAYAQAIATAGVEQYGLVVVDGYQRVECIRASVDWLTPDGVLVLDNSYRHQYREGLELLAARGFRPLAFSGLVPVVGVIGETTIFYRDTNCLNI